MFDVVIINDLKSGTLTVSREIAPFKTGSAGSQDSVSDEQNLIRETQPVPVKSKSIEKVHVIGRQETLVLTLPEEVNFVNCRIIIKSKINLEVQFCKSQGKWKIRETLSQSGLVGSEVPATVNITLAEDEGD